MTTLQVARLAPTIIPTSGLSLILSWEESEKQANCQITIFVMSNFFYFETMEFFLVGVGV